MLLARVGALTADFTCEPGCWKRITLNTWWIQVEVHPSNPLPHVSQRQFKPEAKTWRDSRGGVHDYEVQVICKGANVWLTVPLVYHLSFWLECVEP